ncbi:MAG: response regulator, partial [Terracidiphilus sp.]
MDEIADGTIAGLSGPRQNSGASLHKFDSSSSIPPNKDSGSVASERGNARGMMSRKIKWRILIVDDEAAIADTLVLIFQLQHYEMRVAYSAEQAIEVIAEWRPDLAILDVMLPEMNGIDLAIVIKANYPCCHVLLFSGHANTAMLLEEAGRKGYQFEVLAKPVHPSLMLERSFFLLATPDEPV